MCGTPTSVEIHSFEGNGVRWSYAAPLYHDLDRQRGFCSIECVAVDIKNIYKTSLIP